MFLEKWYADLVVDGQANIHYRANLHLGPCRFGYQCRLPRNSESKGMLHFGSTNLPTMSNGDVNWPAESGGQGLTWHGAAARPSSLWQCGDQFISWNPVVLNGIVDGPGISGTVRGYVERLSMNFGPWQLGLKRLRWGRFCGSKHSLVWIQWEGRVANTCALLNGEPVVLQEATRASVLTNRATLAISRPREIVNESIGSGALKALGLLKQYAPRHFLSGTETKWLARGVLNSDVIHEEGVVIYEEVVWQ